MKLNPIAKLLRGKKKPDLKLFALTPPRKGKRSMVGVENMLGSIAVPEPFSLEIAGDPGGVTVMARCREGSVVKQQLGAHYPQGSIQELAPEEDPLRLSEGEQAWSREVHVKGPEYVPLRPFRSDDLVEEGADPLIALIGSMSELDAGERLVARLDLSSLGPDWSRGHMERAFKRPEAEQRLSADAERARSLQGDGVKMAVLGVGALVAYKGYQWVQDGDMWKTVLLGLGIFGAVMLAGWARWRWNKGRSRIYDPLLIKEKASRIAFAARLEITAILSAHGNRARAERLLDSVAAAYRQYDYAAGASLRAGKVRPVTPYPGLRVPQSGLFRRRNVLGVQEVAALWHPPGAGEDMPLVERSGARVLLPTARGVRSGALVGESTGGRGRQIHFPDDLLRRHHLYVARTRMGKSTLMQHVVAHKLREKAAGRNDDAIVVIDPHADLVKSILKHVPREVEDRVRLIDLGDESRSVGINLLDSRVFYDRDRTADSVVRVSKGLWEQWGPRMQSILEQTVKSLHEANEELEPDEQYTLLDGLRLLSDPVFRTQVLKKVSDPYLLSWWGRDFKGWRGETRADALAPVQTRLSYYATSKRARAILGQSRSTVDLRNMIREGGVLLVSTSQATAGRDVAALVGASLLNLVDAVIRDQGQLPEEDRRGVLVVVDEMQSMPGVDYESMLSELGKFGASFILATQSLAKLADLSPTMEATLLANVGCLAIFQVAASDARTLVWELDRDRVTEEDITSQRVHHCYVRATVGTERLTTFSMTVRKPEEGDPEAESRIRAAMTNYTVPAQRLAANDAEAAKLVEKFRKGSDASEDDAEDRPDGKGDTRKETKVRTKRSRKRGTQSPQPDEVPR